VRNIDIGGELNEIEKEEANLFRSTMGDA